MLQHFDIEVAFLPRELGEEFYMEVWGKVLLSLNSYGSKLYFIALAHLYNVHMFLLVIDGLFIKKEKGKKNSMEVLLGYGNDLAFTLCINWQSVIWIQAITKGKVWLICNNHDSHGI